MWSAGDSEFLFYIEWSEVLFWVAFVEETWRKWLTEVRAFQAGRGIRMCKHLKARACLSSSAAAIDQCGLSDIFKGYVLGDEVPEIKSSGHIGLVSHCKDSGFRSEWDGSIGGLEQRSGKILYNGSVTRVSSWHETSKGKSRDGSEYCFGGLDKSSGSEKWSQSGYILKAEPTVC